MKKPTRRTCLIVSLLADGYKPDHDRTTGKHKAFHSKDCLPDTFVFVGSKDSLRFGKTATGSHSYSEVAIEKRVNEGLKILA